MKLPNSREEGGKAVREAWIEWAKTHSNPNPSWLVPWEELSPPDQEADMMIWERVTAPYQEVILEVADRINDLVSVSGIRGALYDVLTRNDDG